MPVIVATKQMRFIASIMPKIVDEQDWEIGITVICWIEIFLMFLSLIPAALTSILNTKHRLFHWNANLIVMVYSSQYIFSCASRLVLIIDQLKDNGIDPGVVLVSNYIRTGCHFLSFFVLPCFLFERYWASYYLKDYEKKMRLWIPATAIGSLLTLTVICDWLFVTEHIPLLPTLISVMLVNTIGFVGLLINTNYNVRLHRKTLNAPGGNNYSLSERFQIAENIKTSELLANIQLLIFLFTLACATTLVLDFINVDPKILIVAYIIFNFICVAYGFIVPIVCVLHVQVWQRELKSMIHKFLCRRETSPTVLQSTTGEHLSINASHQGDLYFQMFQNQMHDVKKSNRSLVSIK